MLKITLTLFLLLLGAHVFAQVAPEALKAEAQQMMSRGKYGEAIELLNKFISARPKVVDGYTQRGLCFEKRNQYEYAAYDFRAAKKLAPNDPQVNANLNRLITNWYAFLRSKIDGHRREIAINPNIAVNYLEIGKCYKHMGEWIKAEEWYDEYLKREEPSADEVIRYTEILAKNGHIEKGEKILKRFVEKYPKDHRLWSRYGYFTLWLGKKKIAADAFREALKFRPYFKEAMDGLEIAEDRPYVYTFYDTTARREAGRLPKLPPKPQEYAIDKYYRMLKSTPEDTSTRFLLLQELYHVNRLEEAYEQAMILQPDYNTKPKFTVLYDSIMAKRDRNIAARTAEFETVFEKDKSNRKAALGLAENHARQLNYDNALAVLAQYLETQAPDKDPETRFLYAKYAAWNYQFELAIEQMNGLLTQEPDNLEYQLFRAQVAVWTTTDKEIAEQYLANVLAAQPKNLSALLSKATLLVRDRMFPEALAVIESAEAVKPNSKEVETVRNFYEVNLSLEEDRRNFEILLAAREIAGTGDCASALVKYDEYFSKVQSPSRIELVEYADINSCTKNYAKAIDIYDKLLAEEYDYDIALYKAKATMWGGDSIGGVQQLAKLVQEDTSNFDARFFLAEGYERLRDFDRARTIYDSLLAFTPDTAKQALIQKRIGWLPVGGSIDNIFGGIATYTRLAPAAAFYADNMDLQMMNMYGLIEIGLFSNFSAGINFGRMHLRGVTFNTPVENYYTSLKFQLSYYPLPNLYLSYAFGNLSYQGFANRKITEAVIKYDKPKKWNAAVVYANTDAVTLLYSAPLVYTKYDMKMTKFLGEYFFNSTTKLFGHFSYFSISDGNSANDMMMRLGKKFAPDITAGYEYVYTNFARKSSYYYSPKSFASHSLWGEYEIPMDDWVFTLGGKLGYVPTSDVMIRELSAAAEYKFSNTFTFAAKATAGESFRESSSYQYTSAFVSIFWSIF